MIDEIDKNFDWFVDNYKNIYKKYGNAFIAIHDRKIVGVYDDKDVAFKETSKKYRPGTFNIQHCDEEDDPGVDGWIMTPWIVSFRK